MLKLVAVQLLLSVASQSARKEGGIVLATLNGADPAFSFAEPFQGGAVIQRGVPTVVWGAAPSYAGDSVQVSVDGKLAANGKIAGGEWRAELPAQSASFKSTIIVSAAGGTEPLVAHITVSFGDVLLCGGQSNSE
jgi:hypothetical protein